MADDRHYKPGDWYFLDDRSGFKVRSSKARLQWDNVMTSGTHWNPRQPQDMVQGVLDPQAVPWTRSRQVNQFTVLATWVTAFAARGATSLSVNATVGFQVGDLCQVPLDNGNIYQFSVTGISGNVLQFAAPGLPSGCGGTFADPLENTVVDITATQRGGTFSDGSITH
jgi:hypothetical protein